VNENFEKIDGAIEEGIMPPENNEKNLIKLRDSRMKSSTDIKRIIETTYKGEIDRIKSKIKDMYDELLKDYFKTCEEIKQTMDNISGNLEQINASTSSSSSDASKSEKITSLKTRQDETVIKFKNQIEFATTELNVAQYITDENIEDDIIVAIIRFLEAIEEGKDDKSSLYTALHGVPKSILEQEIIKLTRVQEPSKDASSKRDNSSILGGDGRKNNSKSKKNKKSNKNKTKKRKSSTNRKFKFYKVKNILL
jgi:hypothetical protein